MQSEIIKQDVNDIIRNVDLSWMNDKILLITGSTGLLGTYFLHVIFALKNAGQGPRRVYAIVHTDLPQHMREIGNQNWLTVLKGSLADNEFCKSLPKADGILHSAGYGQPSLFLKHEMEALKINTLATFALLDRLNDDGKFLFISSGAVYTGSPNNIFVETQAGSSNTDHPRCCYIEGKRCGEAACNIARRNGIDAKSVRLSFTYGPGVKKDDTRVMYSFIAKALNSGRIQMLDKGAAIHTYCYISDAIEEMLNIMLHGKQGIYNVAGHSETSILALAQRIGKALCADVVVPEEDKGIVGALQREFISPERYETEFEKMSFITMEEGLNRTIEWYRQYYTV